MPFIHHQNLSRRADADGQEPLSGIYIAGIVVASAIALFVSLWLGFRFYRKRQAQAREDKLGGAFLSVRGLVKDDGNNNNEKAGPAQPSSSGYGFSRNQMSDSIVLPDKVLAPRPGAGMREEILNFHRQSGNFPKPFSFALARGAPPSPTTLEVPSATGFGGGSGGGGGGSSPTSPIDNRGSWVRHSFLSAHSGGSGSSANRFSVMSAMSSSSSLTPGEGATSTTTTTGTTRKVRQLFSPVLPDELLLTRLGEQLTVVQSFDDGWCVVGRENASAVQMKTSLFKSEPVGQEGGGAGNVELGVVPAWCFIKPVKGLRAERPVRSTSLGITVQMDGPSHGSRNELLSWSNF